MRFSKFSILGGVALGAASLAASFLISLTLLNRIYYVEWLVVSFMAVYALISWLLYLRDDVFMKKPGTPREHPRSPTSTSGGRKVFGLAALFLALASLILYFVFGIGADI